MLHPEPQAKHQGQSPAKNTDSFCEQDESVKLEVEAFEKVLL